MKSGDRFTQAVITTLAKRAANRCSNPDCNAITSGPAQKRAASVNVGEAAHIFGAHPGSARYDSTMTSVDRADITNAIWLCGNCHKLIDRDVARYRTGLLFEWQKEHERMISEQIGKAGAELRSRYQSRHLEALGKLSYLAERIVIEKGDHWEYRLTAEGLRYEMAPMGRRRGSPADRVTGRMPPPCRDGVRRRSPPEDGRASLLRRTPHSVKGTVFPRHLGY